MKVVRTRDTYGLLRDESDVLAVLGDVQLVNGLFVELASKVRVRTDCSRKDTTYVDSSGQRIVEPLNELDTEKHDISTNSDITKMKNHVRRTLSTSGSTNQSNISSRFNRQVQIPQDTNTRTSWVPEVHALETDTALDVAGDLTLG